MLIVLFGCSVLFVRHPPSGGTVSDYVLALLLLVPAAVAEYVLRIVNANIGGGTKIVLLLCAPVGLLYCLLCLVVKICCEPYTRLIVKSRISDGRLRVSYGYHRDNLENNSLGHFEDGRMFKFLDVFNNRIFGTDADYSETSSKAQSGTETYKYQAAAGADNEDYFSGKYSDEYTTEEAAFEQDADEDDVDENDDLSKMTHNTTPSGSVRMKNKPSGVNASGKTRPHAYIGRRVRVVPTSPFLQLSRVHQVEQVKDALPRVPAPPRYRSSLVPLPLALQQAMHVQKLMDGSMANKDDALEFERQDAITGTLSLFHYCFCSFI
jgi:hypothetical protein